MNHKQKQDGNCFGCYDEYDNECLECKVKSSCVRKQKEKELLTKKKKK